MITMTPEQINGAAIGGAASLPSILMGADPHSLILGFLASILVSTMMNDIDDIPKTVAATVLSSLVAGFFAQHLGRWIAANYPVLVMFPEHAGLTHMSALFIGASIPTAIPAGLAWLSRLGARK